MERYILTNYSSLHCRHPSASSQHCQNTWLQSLPLREISYLPMQFIHLLLKFLGSILKACRASIGCAQCRSVGSTDGGTAHTVALSASKPNPQFSPVNHFARHQLTMKLRVKKHSCLDLLLQAAILILEVILPQGLGERSRHLLARALFLSICLPVRVCNSLGKMTLTVAVTPLVTRLHTQWKGKGFSHERRGE